MQTCPVCRSSVPRGADICDNCGAVLAGVAATAGTQRATVARNTALPVNTGGARTCPNCKSAQVDADGICDNCGFVIGSATPPPTLTIAAAPASAILSTCPNCGGLVSANERFCRKCGYNVGSARLGTAKPIEPIVAPATPRISIGIGSNVGPGGRYRVVKQVGKGGMGAVFLAEDVSLDNRHVVIKALLSTDDADAAQALINERKFLGQIKHANIVGILDFFSIGAEGYIVMEYVAGKTIYQMMEEKGAPLSPADAVRGILAVLPAFMYLHKAGYVYCDFKPQNVMLETLRDGSQIIKLIDLGTVIKHEPNPDAVYGTEGFYAPEAVKHPSPQTDLYTLCRSLAWMVTWMDLMRPQFGMPPSEHYKAFRDYPVLYRFLQKGTSPVAGKRFQSAEQMMDQLNGVLRVVVGGNAEQPVTSKLFATGAMSTTGRLGTKGMAALDVDDKAFDLLRQGDQALRQGNNTAALSSYNQAVGVNPNSVDGHLRLAEVYVERGDYAIALSEITKVQRLDPANWKIRWYTGRLLEAQGNLPSALDQYRELIEDLPGELPPLLALARVHGKMNNDRAAVETYAIVIKADPSNTDALFGASEALKRMQQHDDAALMLMEVRPNSSKYGDAQMRICTIFLNDKQAAPKDLSTVSEALRNLATAGADTPDYLLHRARFYHVAYDVAEAKKLPQDFVLPEESLDLATAKSRVLPPPAILRTKAAEAYAVYLRRIPRNAPERERIVRTRAKVAPWRFF